MSVITHQQGPYVQTAAEPEIVDFGLGQPSPALLPLDAITAAARARLPVEPLLLQYGARPGYAAFREALADLLSSEYRLPVRADHLVVTGGTSLALSMVSQVFAPPGATIVASDPTYFLAAGIFATQHLDVVGVPTDGEGFDVDALAARLASGLKPALVYCIPSFHNPTGVNLAPERARRLVALAEEHDFLIVADEPYPLLHFGVPPPCMMTFDEGRGRVLSLGSMSKILAPGLRLGWAHAEPEVLSRLLDHGTLRSGGCLNPVVTAIVHDCLQSGFLVEHIAQLRSTLGQRANTLARLVRERLQIEVATPGGGYFLWFDLGAGHDTQRLWVEARRDHGVGFTPGNHCAITRELTSWMRLSFAFYDEDEIAVGIDRLAAALGAGVPSINTP